MTSPLENLAKLDAAIHAEPADAAEYEGLVHSGRVRLADARRMDIGLESGFDLAYNASHAIVWRRCGAADIDPVTVTSFSSCFPTRSDMDQTFGGYSTSVIRYGIKASMKDF